MRALLDSHAFLWSASGDSQLSPKAHDLIEDRANTIVFSAASAYEIAVKVALGRLELPEPVELYVPSRLGAFGFESLAIETPHVIRAALLPPIHRDPWDRLLIAQAQLEGLPIVTADAAIARYDVEVIW